jgi:hypothetical protein
MLVPVFCSVVAIAVQHQHDDLNQCHQTGA